MEVDGVKSTTALVPRRRFELGVFESFEEFAGQAKSDGVGEDFFEEVVLFVNLLPPSPEADPFPKA